MAQVKFIEGADPAEIADWIGGRLARHLSSGQGPVAITVPGGSTPFPIFAELTKQPLEWPRVQVWPGDDRIVPEDHAASNTGKIRSLFEPLGAHVIRLQDARAVPHFALAWLGMGGDGHIASLFPNTDPRADDPQAIRHLTPDPLPPEAPFERITLTIPALLKSDELMFVIRGDDKRAVFEAAMRGDTDLPVARLLAASHQSVTCFT